jgi:hypothetical protein
MTPLRHLGNRITPPKAHKSRRSAQNRKAEIMGISDCFPEENAIGGSPVAPMMDWIDAAKPSNKIRNLGAAKRACLLYVSSRISLSVV